MLRSPRGFRIWVCDKPTDMRKSYDTLAALVEDVIRQDPLSGHWFVFVNRRANRMKILCFEGDGYAIWSKRLEAGTFLLPRDKRNSRYRSWVWYLTESSGKKLQKEHDSV